MEVGIGGEESGVSAPEPSRGRDLEIAEQPGSEQLIDQDAVVLGVIAELDHVPVAVVGFQEVGLSASSHFADVPDGGERHRLENRVT